VFSEVGFRGATMAMIAARAGITHAGLLYHFDSKDDVLEAVLSEVSDRGREILGGDAPVAPDHLDALRYLVEQNVEDEDWSRLFSVLLGESVTLDHPLRGRMAARYDLITDGLAGHLRALRGDDSQWTDEELQRVARILVAVMDGLQYQHLTGARSSMPGDFSFLVDTIRAGLRGDRSGSVQEPEDGS
jgi:AcrR family transcriptional regulator